MSLCCKLSVCFLSSCYGKIVLSVLHIFKLFFRILQRMESIMYCKLVITTISEYVCGVQFNSKLYVLIRTIFYPSADG